MRHLSNAPATLTDAEVKALLEGTGRAESDMRDHVLLSIALGTGLRVSEIVALDIGDVANGRGAKGVWTLRPETTKGNRGGTIALPDRLRRKVSRFLTWKGEQGEPVTPEPDADLNAAREAVPTSSLSFCAQSQCGFFGAAGCCREFIEQF